MAGSGPGSAAHPLGFGPVWARTQQVLRSHGPLLWPLAAAFFFLPQLLIGYLAPDHAPTQPQELAATLPLLVAGAFAILTTLIGQLAATFIAVHDGTAGITLGQVLARSARLLLPALALVTIQGIAVLLGGLLFILPGLWILARLSVAMPVFVLRPEDPVEALTFSWRLTEGRALRILSCLAVLLAGVLILYLGIVTAGVALGVVGKTAAGGWGLGRWAFELVSAAATGAIALVSTCFYASLLVALRTAPRTGA